MSGLATLFKRLAGEHDIELSDDELESIGLSADNEQDDETEREQHVPPTATATDIFDTELPGRAGGRIELYLSDELSTNQTAAGSDGLMWEPIIREGQWAVRPGPNGKKIRRPLKVVAGKSQNQLKEIGLQDIVDAFNDEAIEYVTVPSSHNNTTLENQGFIKKLKIVDGEAKDKATKKTTKVKVLLGGYDITEPETKGKMERGSVASRSAGLLYDYTDTERGKTWPVVLEHVALTNKPWITGMKPFGRKVKLSDDLDTVDMRLSDEIDEDAFLLAIQGEEEQDDSFAADTQAGGGTDNASTITWDHEDSPNWLRQQVCQLLDEARSEKVKARRDAQPNSYLYESPPYYRCVEAKPGKALISDGYGDDANFWVADISVADGAVSLADFSTWEKAKKVFVPDDRPDPTPANEPLDEDGTGSTSAGSQPSRIQLAQEARRRRAHPETESTTTPLGGGQKMAEGANGTLDLSEEARRKIDDLEAQVAAEKAKNEKLSHDVDRLRGSDTVRSADAYIDELKAANFDEAHGFGGVLVEVRNLLLADDGEPAAQSDNFADDANPSGEITLSEAVRRIFGAFKRAEDGKILLGESLTEPADPEGKGKEGENGAGAEGGTNASETAAGKPPADEGEGTKLSTDEKVQNIAKDNPEIAKLTGVTPEAESKKGGDA